MTLPPLDAGRGVTAAAASAESVTQLAIAASQPSALPGGSAAAAPAVNLVPSNSGPEVGQTICLRGLRGRAAAG